MAENEFRGDENQRPFASHPIAKTGRALAGTHKTTLGWTALVGGMSALFLLSTQFNSTVDERIISKIAPHLAVDDEKFRSLKAELEELKKDLKDIQNYINRRER